MSNSDPLLPTALIAQHLTQRRAIADALEPTAAAQTILESDTALQHPQLMPYACGTEHLGLAIAYLEGAVGVKTDESLDYDPTTAYGKGIPDVEVQWERSETRQDAPVPPDA